MAITFHRVPLREHRGGPVTFVPFLVLLALAAGALLVTGTLLTLGLLLIPALLILALAYGVWQSRRARQAASAPVAAVPDDAASSATEKSV